MTLVLSSGGALLAFEKDVESEVGIFDSCSQSCCRNSENREYNNHDILARDAIVFGDIICCCLTFESLI